MYHATERGRGCQLSARPSCMGDPPGCCWSGYSATPRSVSSVVEGWRALCTVHSALPTVDRAEALSWAAGGGWAEIAGMHASNFFRLRAVTAKHLVHPFHRISRERHCILLRFSCILFPSSPPLSVPSFCSRSFCEAIAVAPVRAEYSYV